MLKKIYSRKKIDIFGYQIIFINKKKRGFSAIKANTKASIDKSVTLKTYVGFKSNIAFYNAAIALVGKDLSNLKVLDASCGVGVLCEILVDKFKLQSLYACDLSDSCINITRAHLGEKVYAETHNLYTPFKNKYGCIFCTETIEHLLYPEVAVSNILDALMDGGIAIITIPNGKLDTYENHIYFWSIDSWAIFLNKNIDSTFFDIEYGFFFKNQKNLYAKIVKKREKI